MRELDLNALAERLECVERENRWWRLATLITLMFLFCLGAASRSTTLEGERLVIRDAKGTIRAALGLEPLARGWPQLPALPGLNLNVGGESRFGLYMYSSDGVEVARLTADDSGQLFLTDQQQRGAAWIYASNAASMLRLSATRKSRTELAVELEGLRNRAALEKWGPDDQRWQSALSAAMSEEKFSAYADIAGYGIQADSDRAKAHAYLSPTHLSVRRQSPALESHMSPFGFITESAGQRTEVMPGLVGLQELRNREHKTRLGLTLSEEGSPSIELYDREGHARAVLGRSAIGRVKTGAIEQRTESSLVLFNRDETVMWSAP